MKRPIFFRSHGFWLAAAALALATLLAAEPRQPIPQPLAGWSSLGASPTFSGKQIVVPAGAVLFRSFEAGRVSAHLVSRPYFNSAAGDQPAFEVGPAALTFLRDSSGGAVILLGDQSVALPLLIPLEDDGRSRKAIDLTLSYDSGKHEAQLELQGRTFAGPATAAAAGPLTVAVSAGANREWPIDGLEIETAASAPAKHAETPLAAETAGNAAATKPESPVSSRRADAATINRAVLKIETGQLEAAAALLDQGVATRDALTSYQLAALALLERVEELKAAGQYSAYRRVAAAAIKLMEHGLKQGGATARAGDRAEMFAQIAYAAGNHLGDPAAARRNYEQALREMPAHPLAKAAIERLDEDERAKQRLDNRGGGK